MERAIIFALFLMAVIPVSVISSRFLVGDDASNTTSDKILSLPPESTPPIKTEKSSLTSLKSESQNQSELEPPVQTQLEKNQTQESSTPVEPDKKDKVETNNSSNNDNNNNTVLSPPEIEKPKNDTEAGTETKKEGQIGNFQHYLCDDVAASEKCFDENNWVACLQSSNDSKELFLLVENKGQNEISLDINFTPSIILHTKKLPLSKNDSRKVKIIKTDSNQPANITLNSGKGDCILHISPSKALIFSDWQLQFQQLTNYFPTQFSPIYALYFLLFTLVIFLITFACCKFSKRRNRNPNSYKQLEMRERGERKESASSARNADVAETADGWERGWDDDWDDEETGRGVSVNNNVINNSVNNGVSNNSNGGSKDGWDVDWDD